MLITLPFLPAGADGEAWGRINGITIHRKTGPHHAMYRHSEARAQHFGHHSADVQDLGPTMSIHCLLFVCHVPSGET